MSHKKVEAQESRGEQAFCSRIQSASPGQPNQPRSRARTTRRSATPQQTSHPAGEVIRGGSGQPSPRPNFFSRTCRPGRVGSRHYAADLV